MYWIGKFFSKPRQHAVALLEVLLCAAFSLSPFVVAYFAQLALNPASKAPAFGEFLENGQVFLLAYGIFGTLIWLAFVRNDRPRHDARIFFGVISLFVALPILSFMGVDHKFETIKNETVISASYYVYAFVLILNYLLLFYINIDPPEAGLTLRNGADRMRDKYNEFAK